VLIAVPFRRILLKTVFVINPRSGTPKFVHRLHHLIRGRLGTDNRSVLVIRSRDIDHTREIARRATQEGVDMVVAVGGDGTVNAVAKCLVNTDTALGVLPAGSGNGFARNMDIPLRVAQALEVIANPSFKTIDVGQVGEYIFLVSCGIGWEAVIASLFEGSRIRGVIPYATLALTTFSQYEPQEITITTEPDGWTYHGRPMLFSIANMREYGVNVTIAPTAAYDDGFLDICLIPQHTFLDALKYSSDMMRKRTDAIPGYIHRPAKKIIVSRPIAGNIHIDGTPVSIGHEISVQVIPHALKVAVKKGKHAVS